MFLGAATNATISAVAPAATAATAAAAGVSTLPLQAGRAGAWQGHQSTLGSLFEIPWVGCDRKSCWKCPLHVLQSSIGGLLWPKFNLRPPTHPSKGSTSTNHPQQTQDPAFVGWPGGEKHMLTRDAILPA